MLLYCLGEEADDVQTSQPRAGRNTRMSLSSSMNSSMLGRMSFTNVHNLTRDLQCEDETAEQYFTRLYSLAEGCKFN